MIFKKTCTLAVAFLAASAQASSAQSLTSAQAIQVASAFCQSVGYPVTAQATAVYPAPPAYPGQDSTFWLPVWSVIFPSQANVQVVNSTGAVSSYYNTGLANQLEAANLPAGAPITQAAALQFAAQILSAAGPMDPVASPVALYTTRTSPPTTDTAMWNIVYCRMYQGIPYRAQEANVILQGQTGGLIAFGAAFRSPPPVTGPGQVTSAQATTAANAVVVNAGLSTAVFQACTQAVVRPNTYWQPGGSGRPQPGISDIVWDCFYGVGSAVYEVWVDTTTGGVDGGDVGGPLGFSRLLASGGKSPSTASKHDSPTNVGPRTLTMAMATAIADGVLANSGLTKAALRACTQVVVQHNTYWHPGGTRQPQPGVTDKVWDCFYSVGSKTYEVWVDIKTGGIDGGDVGGPLAWKKLQANLGKPLPTVKGVQTSPSARSTTKSAAVSTKSSTAATKQARATKAAQSRLPAPNTRTTPCRPQSNSKISSRAAAKTNAASSSHKSKSAPRIARAKQLSTPAATAKLMPTTAAGSHQSQSTEEGKQTP